MLPDRVVQVLNLNPEAMDGESKLQSRCNGGSLVSDYGGGGVDCCDTESQILLTKCVEVTCALEEYGCFIVTYDGVSQELHDAIFVASQELFDLPTDLSLSLYHTLFFLISWVPIWGD
ncbi:hypothetical protein L1987_45252 [Smallanthus sonchifolius]|uniref:Uncharacterized protein n=1 Tax=Smallanthus sonchifolius TaxID=185202 RepID=A0ACB9GRU2_9ASTR|nr:hypothetical protein L1987_45252 [Smallanthus sonchifolius]